jgi:hypothetical protein
VLFDILRNMKFYLDKSCQEEDGFCIREEGLKYEIIQETQDSNMRTGM